MIIPRRVAVRAATRYIVQNGCYISTYSTASHGYAQIGWQEASERFGTTVHRAAWVCMNGQISDGMTVDHTCKNGRCVRGEHLRLLSNYENARRTAGRDWPLGTCIRGHPNSALQVRPEGKMICATCATENQRRYKLANREKVREAQRLYRARKKAERLKV